MPDFSKSFRLLLDADTKGAVDGLGHFSTAAKTAETQTASAGKGISGTMGDIVAKTSLGQKAMGTFGLSAGQMGGLVATGVGAAGIGIAKFALDSASKFADLGKKVEKFSAVSGLSTDAASRFIAVADDYGVAADTISGSIGKLGAGLGGNAKLLDKYGVAVAHAKDGTIDLTQTTFNVIDAFNKSTNVTQKDALAKAAFGKSFQELIPLITVGSDKIKASFDSVDKSQVFSDKKVKEAKDYDVAIYNLKDQFYDLQLTVGKDVIPILTDLAGTISGVVGPLNALGDAIPVASIGNITKVLGLALNPVKLITTATADLTDKYNKAFNTAAVGVDVFAGLNKATADVGKAFAAAKVEGDGLGTGILAVNAAAKEASKGHDGLGDSVMGVVKAQKLAKVQSDLAIKANQEQQASLKDLQDAMHGTTDAALASQQADLDAADSVAAYNKSLKDSKLTVNEHKQAFLDVQSSIFDASETYADYVVGQEKGAGKIVTATQEATVHNQAQIDSLHTLQSTVAPGSELWNAIQQYIDHLNSIPKSVYTNVDLKISGNTAGRRVGASASGGRIPGNIPRLVGEEGPELFIPDSSGMVIDSARSANLVGRHNRAAAATQTFDLSLVRETRVREAAASAEAARLEWIRVNRAANRDTNAAGYATKYDITVNVAPGADPAAVGRATVEAIKAYERTSGAGWRN